MQQWPITADCKGFGPLAAARGEVTGETLVRSGVGVHDGQLSYPLLTLRESALAHNISAMAGYCSRAGIALAPHGKTTMAPQLAARQLAAGAWGITVATPAQLQTYYRFGVRRLLLANELVDTAGLQWLAATLAADPEVEVCCYVDSVEGVHLLEQAFSSAGTGSGVRPLPVFVELGHVGGRTGAGVAQPRSTSLPKQLRRPTCASSVWPAMREASGTTATRTLWYASAPTAVSCES